jgi:hypothetical protein
METTPSKLAAKVADIVKNTGWIEKAGTNTAQGYKFTQAQDVFQSVRGEFAVRGIAILPAVVSTSWRELTTKAGGFLQFCEARVRYTMTDAESGEQWVAEWAGVGMDSGDKALNKAYTAALKYFLIDLLQIPTGDDPEADATVDHDPPAKHTTQPTPAEKPAPRPTVSPDRAQLESDFAGAWRDSRSDEQKADKDDWKNRGAEVKRITGSARFMKTSEMTDEQLSACINEWIGLAF